MGRVVCEHWTTASVRGYCTSLKAALLMSQEHPILILGLGNTILSDDGVGVYVVRRVRELLAPDEAIDVQEAEVAGLILLDLLAHRRACVVVDAVLLPDAAPGSVHLFELGDFASTTHLCGAHQLDLPNAVALGRSLGQRMPDRIEVIAIQVADVQTLGERCTPTVEASIEAAAALAVQRARVLRKHVV